MNIQKTKNNELEIKTKKAVVELNNGVKVNAVELEGEGEYEIGGISVEGVDDNIYIFKAEELVLGTVDFKKPISKENVEKLSSVEILIIRIDGSLKEVLEQVNQIEPKITIYFGSQKSKENLKGNGVVFDESDELKIAKTDLAEEDKTYFFLTDDRANS